MLSTSSALATSDGSGVCFAYFKTDVVGRTARFCSDVRRLMIASVMPMAQVSFDASEMFWKGSTAMVCGPDFGAAALVCCDVLERGRYRREATKAPAAISTTA